MRDAVDVLTDRLEVRPPLPTDRARFVELFGDADFMVHSDGPYDAAAADVRFDRMLERSREMIFAKQPIIVRGSAMIVGYIGGDRITLDGVPTLEFGYRLVPAARRCGYATEAGTALLSLASASSDGELVTVIDPANEPSIRTSERLGFRFWKHTVVEGDRRYIGRRHLGAS